MGVDCISFFHLKILRLLVNIFKTLKTNLDIRLFNSIYVTYLTFKVFNPLLRISSKLPAHI